MRILVRIFCLMLVCVFVPAILHAESHEAENLNRVIRVLNGDQSPGIKNPGIKIPYERRSLLAAYGGFGSNILVRSQSKGEEQDSARGTFVLAVPLEADFAVDTALALAEKIQNRDNPVNILIAFLGDETNELPAEPGEISHKGFRDLLTLVDMPENWALCYLDANETPGRLAIRHGIRGYLAPLSMIQSLPSLLKARGIPWSFRIHYNVIYKMGLVEGPEPMFIAWEDEINSFVLSGETGSSGETISPENLADVFLDYSGALNIPILNPDRHYFYATLPQGNVFFVSEGLTAALLIITAGVFLILFLLYSVKYNVSLVFHIRIFFRYIWIFFIFFLLLTISVKASGLLYALLYRIFGPQSLNAASGAPNYAGAALTVVFAALIFFLPSPALNLIHFPRRARFYGFSAVIFILMGMFSAAFLDFSYVPIFLWAFVFVFLGASFTNPILIFLCTLLVPIFAIGALANIIATGYGRIAELFISAGWNTPGNWWAALQTALLTLPLFLLAKRGTILIQRSLRRGLEPKPNRKHRLIVVPVLLVLVLGIMVLQIRLIPQRKVLPERRLITEGPETAGTKNDILKLSLDNTAFQDSRIITLGLEARGTPIRFDVSLESGVGLSLPPVYSAPVPFDREDEGRKIMFSLGEHPPNPLSMEIVVPENFEGLLKTTAVYNTWDPAVEPGEKPESGDYILRVSRTVELGLQTAATSGIRH